MILSDYNKGVLDSSYEIIQHLNKFGCKVIVDPKRHSVHYEGAWLVKPNAKEYNELRFDSWSGNIITTSAEGSVTATIDNQKYTVIPKQVEVNDVTGAGDCFLAAFVYALINKKSYKDCLDIAVNAATQSVKHVGTYILKREDIENTVIFTNGCFDVLHKGHLTLLKQARSMGDKLIVGINSDASVKRLKGANRPFNDVNTRQEQLELIPYVDEVIIFDEDTPYELIKKLKPNLIVKGGDYSVEEVIGHNLVPVHIVPTVKGYSTTNIIERKK